MTDEHIRAINYAICLLEDEHHDARERARTALHAVFRRTDSLVADLENARRKNAELLDKLESKRSENLAYVKMLDRQAAELAKWRKAAKDHCLSREHNMECTFYGGCNWSRLLEAQ